MLSISLDAPGLFLARSREGELGRCRFELCQQSVRIEQLHLEDPRDSSLIDGLVRAALFYGLDHGCPQGVVCGQAAQEYGEALTALGFAPGEILPVERLQGRCRCETPGARPEGA